MELNSIKQEIEAGYTFAVEMDMGEEWSAQKLDDHVCTLMAAQGHCTWFHAAIISYLKTVMDHGNSPSDFSVDSRNGLDWASAYNANNSIDSVLDIVGEMHTGHYRAGAMRYIVPVYLETTELEPVVGTPEEAIDRVALIAETQRNYDMTAAEASQRLREAANTHRAQMDMRRVEAAMADAGRQVDPHRPGGGGVNAMHNNGAAVGATNPWVMDTGPVFGRNDVPVPNPDIVPSQWMNQYANQPVPVPPDGVQFSGFDMASEDVVIDMRPEIDRVNDVF